MQATAQVGGIRQTLHVPAEVFAELDRGPATIMLVGFRHAGMLERNRESLLHGWRGRNGSAIQHCTHLREDPRLAKRSTCDHDRVATGLPVHANRVVSRLDVTVANDRN